MGITNGKSHLERKLGFYLSELNESRKASKSATDAAASLPNFGIRIARLEELIRAIELLLREDDPTWNSSRVKPKKKNAFQSPFGIGEAGPMALDVLREASEPMTARNIVRSMFERIGVTEYERDVLDKQANSLGAYLKSHRGVLVDSDGAWPQHWQVIR